MRSPGAPARANALILACVIIAAAFAVFSRTLSAGFVNFDDPVYVTQNPGIGSFAPHFTSLYFGNYHPLTMVSYSLDHLLFGFDPRGYHLVNLLLHIACCLLVFRVTWLLLGGLAASFFAGMLFCVHPLHVEAVAWISGRKELLFSFFFLSSFASYLGYLKGGTGARLRYLGSLFLFFLALLSKSPAVVLPLVLLFADYLTQRRGLKKILLDKIPFLLLSAVFCALAVSAQFSEQAVRPENGAGIMEKAGTALYCLAFYIQKLLIPVNLACLYPRQGIGLDLQLLALPCALVAASALFAARTGTGKKIFFGSAFFAAALLPYLQFVPVSEAVVADRYAYLASFGIIFMAASAVAAVREPRRARTAMVFIAAVVCVFSTAAWRRCAVWNDSLALWNDVIRNYPGSIMAYNNRGITFYQRKEYAKAASDFLYAARFVSDRDRAGLYGYAADSLRLAGKTEEALECERNAREAAQRSDPGGRRE